ncbi:MAG: AAC(3)-I family aminoglycoside N-acetyltransferase [Opitutaceae bacterium]|nr:AAC(3)-I family aminoglycoside N-acetyltransferase [Opitutaceae bacterium]
MSLEPPFSIRRLTRNDLSLMEGMLSLFGEAFQDEATYGAARPGAAYLEGLLAGETFIAIVALKAGVVIGGLAAYELRKFERVRSELYIYDLAVAAAERRQGVATALIREIQMIAKERGAYVIFVQADRGDSEAVALYSRLGAREDVLHFDIPPLP